MTQSSLHYQRIKSFILSGIDGGDWQSGAKIPSENQLAERFSVSRMTVNRAIKELETDGVVDRIQGKGTFVSSSRPLKSVLQIQSIDQEIRERGSRYSCRVIKLRSVKVTRLIAEQLQMPAGSTAYTSSIVHNENDIPMQLEQRWVRPSLFRKYLEQDFSVRTPHDYLMGLAPFVRGEHTIEACLPKPQIRRTLEIDHDEACLLIHRRTWVGKPEKTIVASYVKLFHPGTRFQLTTSMTR